MPNMLFWDMRFDTISWQMMLELMLRLVIAGVCGAIVGFERSKRLKEAGLRTHCVVAVAAALLMIISKYAFADLSIITGVGKAFGSDGADASRIASQIVSGVGFLGAGVIFKNGNVVRGITTAAGIWATAAIGMALGSGMYLLGIFTTAFIMIVQLLMHRFPVGNDAFNTNEIIITMIDTPAARDLIESKHRGEWALIVGSKTYRDESDGRRMIQVTIKASGPYTPEKMAIMMDEHPDIVSITT